MPLMKPRKGQSTSKFVASFMRSSVAKKDFPDTRQRVAVAYSQARLAGRTVAAGRKVPKK